MVYIAADNRFAEESLYLVFGYLVGYLLAHNLSDGQFAEYLVYLAVKLSDTALPRILLYDLYNGLLVELDILVLVEDETIVLTVALHKVALGNLVFLLCGVSCQLYQLHTVEQWSWKPSKVVGCTYEEHIREVIVNVEIVVMECDILLRVKHFEQGRCRVAVDSRLCYLVYLVEDEDRIARADTLQSLHYPSRHSAYVCPSVATYLALVVHASERYAGIFPAHGLCHTLAERCLPHSRRSVEAYYL